MRILIPLIAILAVCTAAATNSSLSATSTKRETKSTKITKLSPDTREKRNLELFGNYGSSGQQTAQRRITTGFNNHQPRSYFPDQSRTQSLNRGYNTKQTNYQSEPIIQYSPHDSIYSNAPQPIIETSGSGNYQHYSHPQYLDAPEPIIEIIIRESNESLPAPPPQTISLGGPKKKEQVQVFYVKYQKDDHKGLVIDKPVPALSPTQYHQEKEDLHDEYIEEHIPVTPLPPAKTTTLRTIIHPDSEKYHSDSGIRVTFSKSDHDDKESHIYVQEHKEESSHQPVVALAPQQSFQQHSSSQFQQQQQHQHHFSAQFSANQVYQTTLRPVDNFGAPIPVTSNFGAPFPPPQAQSKQQQQPQPQIHRESHQQSFNHQSFTQQLPSQNSPSLPFRSGPPSIPQQAPFFIPPHLLNNRFAQQSSQQHFDQSRNLGPNGPPANFQQSPRFPPGPPNQIQYQQNKQSQSQFQQQQQQQQHHQQNQQNQHKPIPIPIHGVQQSQNGPPPQSHPSFNGPPALPIHPAQPFNGPQFSHPSPAAQPQLQSSKPSQPPQFSQQGFFQQPFNNFQQFNKPQPQPPQQVQSLPGPQPPQFRPKQVRPSPPAPSITKFNQQQSFNQFQHHQQQQQNVNYQLNHGSVQGGGLVQQSAPNLAPQQHNPHSQQQSQHSQQQSQHSHQQNQQQFQQHQFHLEQSQILQGSNIQGAELVKSIPKYEQHITETTPFRASPQQLPQQQSLHLTKVQPLIQNSVSPSPPTVLSQGPQFTQNIGPLANNIGHLGNIGSHPLSQNEYHNQIQQQFSQYKITQQEQQQRPAGGSVQLNARIIPNAQPVQKVQQPFVSTQNGQSVSTIYSEVLPEFEKQQIYYSQRDPTNFEGRNNFNIQVNSVDAQKQSPQQQAPQYSTTTTTTQRTVQSTSAVAKEVSPTTKKPLNIQLPDEVPDDLREQLLASGILDNADISILDYDKIGDIPIESLPAEHLANFYGAGGASQLSSSNKVVTVVKPSGEQVGLKFNYNEKADSENKDKRSKLDESTYGALAKKQNVDLKVVRFDSNNQKSVTDKYIKQDSTVLPTVDINDQQYNRYLPLKINGAQFPIPDAAQLKGRKIASVVVLAPVDGLQNVDQEIVEDGRYERDVFDSKQIKFIAGDALKQLIKKPSKDNYKKWLEKESKTDIDLQSVVLLVMKDSNEEQEIFMYDIATKSVNKLNGELSTAFVDVAEENAQTQDIDNASLSDSGIVEQMPITTTVIPESNDSSTNTNHNNTDKDNDDENTSTDNINNNERDFVNTKIDYEQQPSENIETIIKTINNNDKINNNNNVVISSGYSVIKS